MKAPENQQIPRLVQEALAVSPLREFVSGNLRESLASIGLSCRLIRSLTGSLAHLDVPRFRHQFQDELTKSYVQRFFLEIVSAYYRNYILPSVPEVGSFVDFGCGRGVLAHLLSRETQDRMVLGIDLCGFWEWERFASRNCRFCVVAEGESWDIIARAVPDVVLLTWVLHHMPIERQIRCLKTLRGIMRAGSRLVILEDAYSNCLAPEEGWSRHLALMRLSPEERRRVMGIYDWVTNIVLEGRHEIALPFSYRTLEDWESLLASKGFDVEMKQYIGFPEARDVNTPQSLLIAGAR